MWLQFSVCICSLRPEAPLAVRDGEICEKIVQKAWGVSKDLEATEGNRVTCVSPTDLEPASAVPDVVATFRNSDQEERLQFTDSSRAYPPAAQHDKEVILSTQ